jgi:transposase
MAAFFLPVNPDTSFDQKSIDLIWTFGDAYSCKLLVKAGTLFSDNNAYGTRPILFTLNEHRKIRCVPHFWGTKSIYNYLSSNYKIDNFIVTKSGKNADGSIRILSNIPIQDVYAAYHNLWHVERAFRIAKSKIEIRPMFHFTRKRIEAHICICFVALKVYKELERMLKVSEIKMSVDKVLALAKTITTIQIKLPLNKEVYTQTMLMARHQKIAKLFDEEFWGTQ